MFRFVQWELAGRLGPADGRYVVRPWAGEGPEHVLVIEGSARPRSRRRQRGPEPETPITRATVIGARPSAGRADAEAWLARAAGSDARGTLEAALDVLNRAVQGHRVAAADPYVAEVARDRPLATRVGFGTGEQVAAGRWEQARELGPEPATARDRRDAALRPQERLAALLGSRDAALACEELALRARLDFERGRDREGTLQAHIAVQAACFELAAWRGLRGMEDRLTDLESRREVVAAAAGTALEGGVGDAARDAAVAALDRLQAALRARSAASRY